MTEKKKTRRRDRTPFTQAGHVRPATPQEQFKYFQDMLEGAKQEKKALKERLKEVNGFIGRTEKAIEAMRLYAAGYSPHDIFQAEAKGITTKELLENPKK